MVFSAMLAQEYIIRCINFTQQQFGLMNQRISAQQIALAVVIKNVPNFNKKYNPATQRSSGRLSLV